jgi:hypothetical protein
MFLCIVAWICSVMELFVFIHMGGGREDVVVKLLDAGPRRRSDKHLARGLADFDAGKAKCFLVRDRQRLLAVIEASFGTFSSFNTMVRSMFADRLGLSFDDDSFRKGSSRWSFRAQTSVAV